MAKKTKAQKIGAIQAKIEHKRIKTSIREYRSTQVKNGIGLFFGLLLLVILIVNVFKFANGGSQVTFSAFLSFLSNFDVGFELPNLNNLIDMFTISKKWSLLDGFRIFLNSLGSILGLVAYLGANIVYTITFLSKFIIFLLG